MVFATVIPTSFNIFQNVSNEILLPFTRFCTCSLFLLWSYLKLSSILISKHYPVTLSCQCSTTWAMATGQQLASQFSISLCVWYQNAIRDWPITYSSPSGEEPHWVKYFFFIAVHMKLYMLCLSLSSHLPVYFVYPRPESMYSTINKQTGGYWVIELAPSHPTEPVFSLHVMLWNVPVRDKV